MDLTLPRIVGASLDLPETGPLEATWLGRCAYREIWAMQKILAGRRASGSIGDRLLLVEHDQVLTLGRHADETHVRASVAELARREIEVIRVERGGEVTYHGPGQLVAYPIIALGRRGLLVRPLVRALETAMAATCAAFGITAGRRDGHPGSWIDPDGPDPRKIGALGIRVERGVSYHGIALNIDPDLTDFELIDACGLPGTVSTSIAFEAGWPALPASAAPERTATVERAAGSFARAFARAIDVRLVGFGSGPEVLSAAAPAPAPGPAPAAAAH
ncbi:MAG TPA: lipoyl(octanoyl) transferase LipB [Patescibacteria group bacterium]|nr:lipoyl(octanoyl) transferase LipB [Patescibacteria group bacterium]